LEEIIKKFNFEYYSLAVEKNTFIVLSYGEIYDDLITYALYKYLFNEELFSLEKYLDDLLKIGSTFSDCGRTHIVLCKYDRKKLKVSISFIDYKNEPYVMSIKLDFENDILNSSHFLGNCYFYRKCGEISEKDIVSIKDYANKIINNMKDVLKTINFIE
jgi:hypothetical protein